MTRSTGSRMARWMGRMAAVGAVALLLVGSAAAPAAAAPNKKATDLIDNCTDRWGKPYYFEFMGVWGVGCDYSYTIMGGAERE